VERELTAGRRKILDAVRPQKEDQRSAVPATSPSAAASSPGPARSLLLPVARAVELDQVIVFYGRVGTVVCERHAFDVVVDARLPFRTGDGPDVSAAESPS